ncbi:MAG: hypothetical protein RIQ79_1570, partial [Verrucomicrobiota bacterium]
FGMSLLVFGIVMLVAIQFGYVPRKLANLTPSQIRVCGASFTVIGALLLGLGDNARRWKAIGLGFLALLGLGVLLVVASVLVHKCGRRTSYQHPAPPPPAAAQQSNPPRQSTPVDLAVQAPREGPAATREKSPMMMLFEKRRIWEKQFGRERVWNIVVHLRGTTPPADLETRLSSLVTDSSGGALVVPVTNLIEATVAPVDGGDKIKSVLITLFPGATIRLIPGDYRVVVIANPR